MKSMVIYYSRADENYFGGAYRYVEVGNTEKAAEMIADLTGAELFRIEQITPYSADYKQCVAEARADKINNARPEIEEFPDIDDADIIYLGYPNYCGTMPMAVYTLLEKLDWTGKTIYPFCTHEGSGLSATENDIAKAAKGAKVEKGLAIYGSSVDTSKSIIEKWLKH